MAHKLRVWGSFDLKSKVMTAWLNTKWWSRLRLRSKFYAVRSYYCEDMMIGKNPLPPSISEFQWMTVLADSKNTSWVASWSQWKLNWKPQASAAANIEPPADYVVKVESRVLSRKVKVIEERRPDWLQRSLFVSNQEVLEVLFYAQVRWLYVFDIPEEMRRRRILSTTAPMLFTSPRG
jgi:CRISPR/Cas system-associated endoribonuclease Cas2